MINMTSTEAKTHFGALLDMAKRNPVTLEKSRPVAVLLSEKIIVILLCIIVSKHYTYNVTYSNGQINKTQLLNHGEKFQPCFLKRQKTK